MGRRDERKRGRRNVISDGANAAWREKRDSIVLPERKGDACVGGGLGVRGPAAT